MNNNFNRRNMLTGLIGFGLGTIALPAVHSQQNIKGRLQTSQFHQLSLSGKTRLGTMAINAEGFVSGKDRIIIASAKIANRQLYRAFYSYNYDRIIFLQLRDDKYSTTLVLSDTEDPKIGRITVWNDKSVPENFRVDIQQFLKSNNHKESILDGAASKLDMVGKRNPISLTEKDLKETFGKDPKLTTFLNKTRRQKNLVVMEGDDDDDDDDGGVNWECAWICLIPACGLTCLLWEPV